MGIFRDAVERAAERLWYRERGVAFAAALPLLGPATLVTAALSRRRVRRQAAASPGPLPVIAVGNLTVGGTGKTQVVAALAESLQAVGRRVAIVTRGYGGSERGPRLVSAEGESALFGDEALLLARRFPKAAVIVARDRAAGVALAAAQGSQVVLLDDGLQQAQLAPTCRVAVFGAECPLGNGALLPLGPLRDSLLRLRPDDTVWVHGEGDAAPLPLPRVDIRSRTAPISSGELSTGRRVFAFAGIARPERFFRTLTQLGVSVVGTARYADHRRFRSAELRAIEERAKRLGAEVLVCTEKDAVRLPDASRVLPIVALETRLEIVSGEEKLAELIQI